MWKLIRKLLSDISEMFLVLTLTVFSIKWMIVGKNPWSDFNTYIAFAILVILCVTWKESKKSEPVQDDTQNIPYHCPFTPNQ